MERWPAISDFLTAHHGCIDLATLDALGVTRHQRAHLVSSGRLEKCAPRVWRLVGSPRTWEQRLAVGLLSLGPVAAVSHWAAARLHGLDGVRGTPVEFLVPDGRHHVRIDERVHRSTRFRRTDFLTVDGFRSTSATRVVFDLANDGEPEAVVARAMDSAVHLQLSAPEAIRRRLATIRGRGRAGVRLVERLLADSGGHTVLERAFLRLMRDAGLPRPVPQVVFEANGVRFARVDFVYVEWSIVVEVSGRRGHSSAFERARDAHRRNELQDQGLTVVEYTYEQVTEAGPLVVSQMRRRLTAAGWVA